MNKLNYDATILNEDLENIVAEANEARAAYFKEVLSNVAKKVINLFSTELPASISKPLAHR